MTFVELSGTGPTSASQMKRIVSEVRGSIFAVPKEQGRTLDTIY